MSDLDRAVLNGGARRVLLSCSLMLTLLLRSQHYAPSFFISSFLSIHRHLLPSSIPFVAPLWSCRLSSPTSCDRQTYTQSRTRAYTSYTHPGDWHTSQVSSLFPSTSLVCAMNQQYQDHNMAYGRPGDGDQVMYAPFAQYDAPPPPPQSQGLQYPSYYPMNEPMDPNHPSEMQFSAPAPTRLRARRAPGERGSLEVAVHPYNMDGRPLSPNRYSPGIPPMPPLPPKSSLRGKTAEEEEARKARKREMGRERQRRKRMRDKAKREVSVML